MSMTIWNPSHEMDELLGRYNHAMGRTPGTDDARSGLTLAEWSPTVDIDETADHYRVRADLPGVPKDDIEVSLENGVLSIKGEKHTETETGKGTKRHRTERYTGSFVRYFTLPNTIKADKVDASYKDGVLTLLIPKVEEAKPKAIDIKVH